jgi:RNA polymerase sigma-70 factor (ECF subfamily)
MRNEAPVRDFAELADPHRRELLVHCYRMLGSMHDAEDLVQDTMLRAWRSRDTFDGERASMRTWLYRIATNACLTALDRTRRRPLPSGLADSADRLVWPLPPGRSEVAWLEPMPTDLLGFGPTDPAAVIAARDSVRLAFVAALQHLPPRQRAVLILRDVLAMPAADVADQLGTTVASVNSALQRARAHLAEAAPAEDDMRAPSAAEERSIIERYTRAFVAGDIATVVSMLREDVTVEMPPTDIWYAGRDLVSTFFASRSRPGRLRASIVGVNGRPGLATYRIDETGVFRGVHIQSVTIVDGRISRLVSFLDPSLFETFGLPAVWPGDPSSPAPNAQLP